MPATKGQWDNGPMRHWHEGIIPRRYESRMTGSPFLGDNFFNCSNSSGVIARSVLCDCASILQDEAIPTSKEIASLRPAKPCRTALAMTMAE
jgi:hypothetical protein